MAQSPYSPSISPVSPSPSATDSSVGDRQSIYGEHPDAGVSGSRPVSPAPLDANMASAADGDTVTCQWEECGIIFTHLPTLIEHIHNDHIGVHKSNYTCEWATCTRRSLAQTSRFALISHIRSHTGEKPFTCPRPECDKSFTRSDALAKHMRLQHNISPPLPGRGGNRKRKRDEADSETPQATALASGGQSGFNTFKVEPHTPSELDDLPVLPSGDQKGDYFAAGGANTNGISHRRSTSPGGSLDGAEAWDEGDDGLPPHLLQAVDPQTGLILGRPPAMVKYLVMKAKHRFVLEQHEQLIEELRVARAEMKKQREQKDATLDFVLRQNFGPQVDLFLDPIPSVEIHGRSRPSAS